MQNDLLNYTYNLISVLYATTNQSQYNTSSSRIITLNSFFRQLELTLLTQEDIGNYLWYESWNQRISGIIAVQQLTYNYIENQKIRIIKNEQRMNQNQPSSPI
ncbi:Hypothetical_protein [Hexamita inflata]|uniref:Hypothetical_protein n=1 Tax=Hexamita inflata TaxID=28002 RepID=A0AA86ULM9_9EUKA|nr:Hypothetical protein HINF_LOCUS47954 [Hexamita inflata]